MRAELANKIAPPSPIERTEYQAKTPLNEVKDSNDSQDIDFRSLLANSSENVQATRKAQKQGQGLNAAKSDQEFFDMLRKQTNQRPAPKNVLDKDDFLKLFVAQLQNQNPLQPKEDADMAAQMAHFNSLEQMVNVNKKLEEMNASQRSGQSIHLVNFVGKEITIADGRSMVKGGETTGLRLNSKAPLDKILIEARDGSGQIVGTQEVAKLKPGGQIVNLKFTDKMGSPLADGVYTLSAKNSADPLSTPDLAIETVLTVKGIDLQEGGHFTTDIGKISQEQVKSVGESGFTKLAAMQGNSKPQVDSPPTALPNPAGATEPSAPIPAEPLTPNQGQVP